MAYIFIRRSSKIIVIDCVITSAIFTFILWKQLEFHWALMFAVFLALFAVTFYTFFKWTVVRYVMTLLFSMLYGLIAYYFGSMLQRNGVSVAVVFAFVGYFSSLSMHKSYFDFLTNAKAVEYE